MSLVTVLWAFAVFLASVFAAVLIHITLTPKGGMKRCALGWLLTGVVGYTAAVISYQVNLTLDLVGILGLSLLVCVATEWLYEGTTSSKLFVATMACLITNVVTFLFCGTTDTILGMALHLFDVGTPYNVPNISLFIGIKLIVYAIIGLIYHHSLRKRVIRVLEQTQGNMRDYLNAPVMSIICFYGINMITNSLGILPTNQWFFPLYAMVCLIVVVEYVQIFNSVNSAALAMEVEREKERIGAELNVATQIQADMLPSIFPPFPELSDEFDIYATMHPAKEVGGDFYDFFLIDEDHLGIVMADVSGKGVPAALFMVIAKTLIKNRAMMGGGPAEILSDVNDQLCQNNKAQLFVTVWLGILELSTGRGVAANAGHEHPVLRRAGGAFEQVIYRHSPAVAAMEGIRFRQHEFEMHPGDTLFIYTDGLTEATNAASELFGDARLVASLNRHGDGDLNGLLTGVRDDIQAFVGEAPQFDDMTMLGLTYLHQGGAA